MAWSGGETPLGQIVQEYLQEGRKEGREGGRKGSKGKKKEEGEGKKNGAYIGNENFENHKSAVMCQRDSDDL